MPTAAEVAREYNVNILDLSHESQTDILTAISVAETSGELGQLDVRELVFDANAAEMHAAQAEEYQREQTKAADAGNWDLARDYAQKANYEREAAADHGAEQAPVIASEQDVVHLDNARWDQRIANENAAASADYARQGDMANAAVYGEVASRHQATADQSAHMGTLAADSATETKREADTPEHEPDASAAASSTSAAPEPTPEPIPEG